MKPEKDDDFGTLLEQYSDQSAIEAAKKEKEASGPNRKNSTDNYPKNPQDTLDLHQFSSKEAEMRADGFLRISKGNGLKTVMIITGKGLHSADGEGKLRGIVRGKVMELKRQGIVADFKWDQREEKRSGTIIVYLT